MKACTPSKNGRYDFMLLGHMDTVFPQGEVEKRPFTIRDGKATSVLMRFGQSAETP